MSQPALHIPSLNGVRAVAVLIVFVGHGFTAPGLWPGHVGVTIFFFLSGYLITTLLRREREKTGRIALGKFYLRRLLRIQPPALVAIALCVLVGVVAVPDTTQNAWGILAEVFNVTNYYMVAVFADTGNAHHGLPPESSMLWSLAVEEHFYLLFPALMIGLALLGADRRRTGWILLGMAAVAPVWRIFLHLDGATFYRLYVSTDTRYDGLLVGAAVALLWNPALGDRTPFAVSRQLIDRVLTPAALIVFAAAALAPHPFRLTVVDTLLYLCLVPIFWTLIASPDHVLSRSMNHRWVAHIGLLSFSIYLLHRLVLAIVERGGLPAVVTDGVAFGVTIAAAQVVFVTVERPLGDVRKRLEGGAGRKAVATASEPGRLRKRE
ncbi:acyltransferase [Nocardioides zeae]|uniref:Acyltransferase n=1 Tax=Nocardioides imazamoxiresistens TaxID=3231893 RepID=A0ABU3PXF3_9ACTN|nr:acyltransferase [Nocardioides zeae]MDT9593556.1 acyltransferase [Nocardioides zeae]